MEADKIFFGEQGLTTTSANFIANVAKEMYAAEEEKLSRTTFYDNTVKLLSADNGQLLREGTKSVDDVKRRLEDIAELKSLIAWLREAIKAKERLRKEAQNLNFEELGIQCPQPPEMEKPITDDEYIATMGIKQRNRYYQLDSYCATIGQAIHPNGWYASARKELQKAMTEPNVIEGHGRDAVIYGRTPSINPDKVEETYMELQQTYREYQAELNSIKYEIEQAVKEDESRKNIEHQTALATYFAQAEAANHELETKRKEMANKAAKLKIIIPDNLKQIYQKVQDAGKKKKQVAKD